jgi:serine/threonine-protein kinase
VADGSGLTRSERWQRVQQLCDALEEAGSAAERDALLEKLEPDDAELRAEALALLQAGRDEEELQRQHGTARREPWDPPGSIGGIRILDRIGAGGSGEVFRGIRIVNGTQQIVAVKRFHAHRAGPEHLERFAREQQMLAALTHPDIVRFLDAGVTAEGQPFLVMELAEGQPLTAYCDRRRLRLADRLRLFVSVCDAVQSAHRHLIVHLDLKPSNILVTELGRVKLLDFGAAKLVDPAAGLTRTEPMTLLYASPERLRGEPVTVACDVYSLGLILYELVSGAWPFAGRDSILSVAERATGEATIAPLSTTITEEAARCRGASAERLRSAVRGDLDAIVSRTLAPEASARYSSVAELADDVLRHLASEPVRARPPRLSYLLGRFVRRHAWEVGVAAALVVGLTAAAAYSIRQAGIARAAADTAHTQNRFLTSLFTLAGSDASSRHDMTVRDLLALAEERIGPALGGNAGVAADVEVTLAQGYLSQNEFDRARGLLERAVGRAGRISDPARESQARALLAYVHYVQNRNDRARRDALAALAHWEEHRRRFTPAQAIFTLRTAASTLSYVSMTDPVHRPYFEACVSIARSAPADLPAADRSACLVGLATSYTNVDSRYDEAEPLLQEALALQRAEHASATMAETLQMLGFVHRHRGRFADDERSQREAYEILARLQGRDSVAARWQEAVWATSLVGVGKLEEAYARSRDVLAAARKLYPVRGSYLLWTPLASASAAACTSRRLSECEALAAESIETLGPQPAPDDPRLASARGLVGVALAARGRHAEAKPLLDEALAMNARRKRTSPVEAALREALAACERQD